MHQFFTSLHSNRKKIGVVCHDAGAANILGNLVAKFKNSTKFLCYTEGPAKKIWSDLNLVHLETESAKTLLDSCELVMTGTGKNILEHNVRKKQKNNIAILDHWVNYRERFTFLDETCLPSEIWVVDQYANKIASQAFPNIKIVTIPNYYSEAVRKKLKEPKNIVYPSVLYVSQSYNMEPNKRKNISIEVFKYFLDNIHKIGLPKNFNIILRPHPDENPLIFKEILLQHKSWNIILDSKTGIEPSLSICDWVVGGETAALALALDCGKKVFCCLPPNSGDRILPHRKIQYIREF